MVVRSSVVCSTRIRPKRPECLLTVYMFASNEALFSNWSTMAGTNMLNTRVTKRVVVQKLF